ncbi:MAG TPA: PEP-CTERM sorting domain-containing protein [Planktothrix sp. UBA8407]|jgi:PEP-CTERM putative exosortase interaction domain|nr:PEP-CTERM sorting domain-containing protein [Planktothrix sp. UBA8402]HAO10623.1 PEP-CTERM sorting domain-containing protein [Planktothrix sp. UBA8407]HBK23595.1 PEP-CTERM sorting domain-containing protein [Planktothrix sp. UBA10369]
MATSLKKLLIGTSVAVGISATASLPAKAASFDFNNSETNYATYTHNNSNNNSNLWIKSNEAAAISALTDGNLQTNVELNYTNETNSSSVGFTATAGKHTAKVSSVTTAEFNTFQGEWLNGLLNAYQPLKNVWNSSSALVQSAALEAFKSSVGFGDPNIGEFSLDETGAVSMKTLGFLDLKPRVNSILDAAVNGLSSPMAKVYLAPQVNSFKAVLGQIDQLQISEIVKVELDGVSEYVYSFNATDSGFVAWDDTAGKSYSGVYSWSKAGTPAAVPEPSTILGLMAIGGLFGAAKRNANKKA